MNEFLNSNSKRYQIYLAILGRCPNFSKINFVSEKNPKKNEQEKKI